MNTSKNYTAIGIMSGTSLDGIDLAACTFFYENNKWGYKLIASKALPYSSRWQDSLKNAPNLNGLELHSLNIEYGNFLGSAVKFFIEENRLKPDLVSSHGHTIFHNPEKGITMQIGSGAEIAAQTQITTICDFRSLDVALGGQGAPLVPIGDKLLFSEYKACVNLGGFANITQHLNNRMIAFDICPANIILNTIAQQIGKEYDAEGDTGRGGVVHSGWLSYLNNLTYYKSKSPKSLGREWVEKNMTKYIDEKDISPQNKLRTYYEHIAVQISNVVNIGYNFSDSIMITGGGAHNKLLIDLIKEKVQAKICIPDKNTVDYKEAIIFSFLGVLRLNNIASCNSGVTGAIYDNIGGAIYEGKKTT